MTDARQIPAIAERYDLDWRRYPNRWRRWRGRAGWCAALAGLLFVSYPLVTGDHRPFMARPLSAPHRLFEADCRRCHDRHGQPLLRLAGVAGAHSVSDQACQACHEQRCDDHHPQMLAHGGPASCMECHQEHRGRSVREVADTACVACHADLVLACRSDQTPHVRSQVVSWQKHPEFAGKRPKDSAATAGLLDELAQYDERRQRWRDRTALRFNHRVHLDPDGIPIPPDHPDYQGNHHLKRLECQDCHQPMVDGRAMQPIRFEQHCQPCHRLEFRFALAEDGPLPHGDIQLALGVLRDRLMRYLQRHPQEVDSEAVDRSVLPGPQPLTPTGEETPELRQARAWQWVERRWQELSGAVVSPSVLYAGEPGAEHRQLKTGCGYCHEVMPQQDRGSIGWQVTEPRMPARWMPMARFSHQSHQFVRCVDCHYDGQEGPGATESEDTADLLLPSREVCLRCHVSSGSRASSGSAPTRCVDCHQYHGRSYERIKQLASGNTY
ncbi:MAG: hypothetical protein KatS3mg110_0802 [Pirellulaceae bacterium]|nr:MAG: hypothetical protein KatS3mg110_0802 [Pirellulaceae bacterium]